MEAYKADHNRTGHGNLQEVDSFHLLHPEIYQGGSSLNKKSNVSSSPSESSHENMVEIVNEIQSQLHDDEVVEEHKDETLDRESETRSHDSSEGDHIISLFDIPTTQIMERDDHYNPGRIPESVFASTEGLAASADWSTTSNESLFSIHPSTFSYGGDHPFFLAPEMHIVTESQASVDDKNIGEENKLEEKESDQSLVPADEMNREKELASIEHVDEKNVWEEKEVEEKEADEPLLQAAEMHREKESQASIEAGGDKYAVGESKEVEEKEPSQVKTKQPNERILNLGQDETKLPSASMIFLNHSPRSDGSDGSDYSFAFPILVSNQIQKGDGLSSRRGVSGRGLESSIARRQEVAAAPQQQQPSPHKRECWCCCCCHPFLSFFRCCFGNFRSCYSCCRLPSCCSVQSCLSCCNFPSCYSCCARLPCRKCFCFCCWPCR